MTKTHKSRQSSLGSHTSYRGGSVLLVLICCGVGIFLLTTSYWGDKLVNEYIAPTFAELLGKATPTAQAVFAQPQELISTPVPVESIAFELPESSWYLLQMGTYADPEQAHLQAQHIQALGAGGYIFEDKQGFWRVFAAAYADQDSLLQVQKQIQDRGYENTAYSIHPKGVAITLTGDRQEAQAVEQAMQTIWNVPGLLTDFSLTYDGQGLSALEAAERLSKLFMDITDARKLLQQEDSQGAARELDAYAGTILDNISTFLTKSAIMNQTECAAALKHLQIDCIMEYEKIVQEII